MDKQTTPADRSPIIPLPFTREQVRSDILNIVLFEMRRLRHITGEDATLPGIAELHPFPFWDAGCSPEEIGITYEQVANFSLAKAVEDYFDFGLYAVTGTLSDDLEWDSIHTWIGAYLVDLSKSMYAQEWGPGEGHYVLIEGINRCLYLCELANARVMLEGRDHFYHFSGVGKDEDGGTGLDDLSIRQLAMLAGMEELSLRSYISRKTAPILEICKDDRRTFIKSDVAVQWLTAKGRYAPVAIGRTSAGLDLAVTRFSDCDRFTSMLRDRQAFMSDKSPDATQFAHQLEEVLRTHKVNDLYSLSHENLSNPELMEKFAALLELPADLLKLRAREAVLKTEILIRERELKQLQE